MSYDTARTFWSLLASHQLVIPIIQRDYAQGREDRRTEQVRRNFVGAIKSAISNADADPLDLGLVYGDLRDSQFTVLDGQQRLTTLFLVHWYLAKRTCGTEWPGECRDRLARFTYETRTSARTFCHALATEKFCLATTAAVREEIEDAPWFFLSWLKDPTIHAMLVMLDAIHSEIKEADHGSLWSRLTKAGPPSVHFQLLELKRFGLTDELYIKMNARGRPLTEFEQFKAWLEHHAEVNHFDLRDCRWKELLDKDWADLFWKHREKDSAEMIPLLDAAYLRFFRGVTLNHFVASGAVDDELGLIKEVVADTFIPTETLSHLFFASALCNSFQILERLKGGGLEQIERQYFRSTENPRGPVDLFLDNGLFKAFVSGGSSLTFEVRVLFYALSQFLVTQPADYDGNALLRWMRVMRNLTVNTTIGRDEYQRTLRTVRGIDYRTVPNILCMLASSDSNLPGFLPYQVAEEKQKARLVLANSAWEQLFADAENHAYFRGQIGFLIEMSRTGESRQECVQSFERYLGVAKRIFAKGGLIEHEEFLVHRALLAIGDYLPAVGDNHSFGKDAVQWRELIFRNDERRDLLRTLFDDLLATTKAGEEENRLRYLIANANTADWRQHFIECHEAIEACKRGNIRFFHEQHILLLQTNQTNGYHAELRSYCFYVRHLAPKDGGFAGCNPDYRCQKSVNLAAYASLEECGYRIEIRYRNDADATDPYEITTARTDGKSVPEVMIQNCAALGMKENEAGCVARFSCEDTAFEGLKRIVATIQSLRVFA